MKRLIIKFDEIIRKIYYREYEVDRMYGAEFHGGNNIERMAKEWLDIQPKQKQDQRVRREFHFTLVALAFDNFLRGKKFWPEPILYS